MKETKIVEFSVDNAHHFGAISREWVSRLYAVEPLDEAMFNDPQGFIVNKGGAIIYAEYKGEIAGTCALLNTGKGTLQMSKMGVYKKYDGLGLGRVLCKGIVDKAREMKAQKIILFSNTKGSKMAINLYRKFGFQEVKLENADYNRADIKMELNL